MTPGQLNHEVRFTQVASGARIAWARSGRAGAPVLIRTPHWLTHVEHDLRSSMWRPLIERLGRQMEIVRYDERGCGLSSADEVPLSLDTSLEELHAVVAARGAARFALLGISRGTPAAVAFAAQHPDRVSHLVLLGGAITGLMHRQVTPDVLAFHEARLRLCELGWGRKDPGVQQMFTSGFMPDASAEHTASFNEHQRISCDGVRAAAIWRAHADMDVRGCARTVRVPTLVLHSEGDLAVPVSLGHELAAAIPNARFEALQSRNHIPLVPEPEVDRLCQLVTAFVTEAAARPALTPAERALAALVGQGLDNLQITAHLGLAEKTVRNRLSALYAKLGVEGRAMAVVRARELGL
jgi:pimeloyl-ACP methyl ester carboxylesterase